MENVKDTNLHPTWMFSWWSGQAIPNTKSEERAKTSKRERMKDFMSAHFKSTQGIFRRKLGRQMKKGLIVESANDAAAAHPPEGSRSGTRSGGYKIVTSTAPQETSQLRVISRASCHELFHDSAATQEEKLTARSLADTSENRSLLRRIRLRWLQNSDFGIQIATNSGARKLIPQSICFLREMCPGPPTTEVSCSYR